MKFEEELKKLNVEVIKHPIGDTHYLLKNQVESIVRKADKEINWLHSLLDERNEEVLQTVKLLNEAQPEIPEVPQFVADWYEENKASLDYMIFETCRNLTDESTDEFENWFGYDNNKAITTLVNMKNGYTVKDKRFYLKNKLTGLYLRSYTGISMNDTTLRFEEVSDNRACGFGGGTQFTQQEIDSMAAESYEQIEVEEKA